MDLISNCTAIILAAGKGTRMDFDGPKVLAPLNDKPMLHWVIESVQKAGISDVVVVVGHRAAEVEESLEGHWVKVKVAHQAEQLGTANAVMAGMPFVPDDARTVLIANGDKPLMTPKTFAKLVHIQQQTAAAAVLSVSHVEDPSRYGYGRVVRDGKGRVQKIIEQKVLSPEESAITECNAGSVAHDAQWLRDALAKVQQSKTGEYYLTELVDIAYQENERIEVVEITDPAEAHGVNTMEHLDQAHHFLEASN